MDRKTFLEQVFVVLQNVHKEKICYDRLKLMELIHEIASQYAFILLSLNKNCNVYESQDSGPHNFCRFGTNSYYLHEEEAQKITEENLKRNNKDYLNITLDCCKIEQLSFSHLENLAFHELNKRYQTQ